MLTELSEHKISPIVSLLPRLRVVAQQLLAGETWPESPVDPLSLFLQLGLHLPRFDWEAAISEEVMRAEGERLKERLISLRQGTAQLRPSKKPGPRLSDLELAPVSETIAKPILEQYHYLMSFRPDSLHFGLMSEYSPWPWVLLTLSPFDLKNLKHMNSDWLKFALVLSRVYAFPGTPPNAISFALAKLRQWLIGNRPETTALLTYCNPNLGFGGSSYEADNWQLLGYEHKTRYAYHNGNYVTDRRLQELSSGTFHKNGLPEVSYSQWPLEPLWLYTRTVHRSALFQTWKPEHYERWMPEMENVHASVMTAKETTW